MAHLIDRQKQLVLKPLPYGKLKRLCNPMI